eukprot:jgi/Botrbrau1/20155/Bobra.0173s0056.1
MRKMTFSKAALGNMSRVPKGVPQKGFIAARLDPGIWRGLRSTGTGMEMEVPSADSQEDRPTPSNEPIIPAKPLTAANLTVLQLAQHQDLHERFRGKLILAPLTRGGTVPFRRLCADFGAEVTMSEMAYARKLAKGDRGERARLRKAQNESCFGVQIATNNVGEGLAAARLAAEAGASWLDLNCGCPIHEATRRGLGAALLRSPRKLGRLVAGISEGSPLPLTVKDDFFPSVQGGGEVWRARLFCVPCHMDHVTGRTIMGEKVSENNGKKKGGNVAESGELHHVRGIKSRLTGTLWAGVARDHAVPIIGNGDILTYYDARKRLAESTCLAVMTGAGGAGSSPGSSKSSAWAGSSGLSAMERVEVYRRLVTYMKEYFGDDARGRGKAFYFFPWHFDFFHRYRPFPEERYGGLAAEQPLMLRRWDTAVPEMGEEMEDLPPLERLLRCSWSPAHAEIASVLWGQHIGR